LGKCQIKHDLDRVSKLKFANTESLEILFQTYHRPPSQSVSDKKRGIECQTSSSVGRHLFFCVLVTAIAFDSFKFG